MAIGMILTVIPEAVPPAEARYRLKLIILDASRRDGGEVKRGEHQM